MPGWDKGVGMAIASVFILLSFSTLAFSAANAGNGSVLPVRSYHYLSLLYPADSPIRCVIPISGNYVTGANVLISAQPSCAGQLFLRWNGTGSGSYTGTSRIASVAMKGNIIESAVYGKVIITIPVARRYYHLTMVYPPTPRTLPLIPISGNVISGSEVHIIAAASCGGAKFVQWSGTGTNSYSGTSKTAVLTMEGNIVETAIYNGILSTTTINPTSTAK